jgi:hypothetical protein
MPLQVRAMPWKHSVPASLANLVVNIPCHISRAVRHEVAVSRHDGHCIISSMAALHVVNQSSVHCLHISYPWPLTHTRSPGGSVPSVIRNQSVRSVSTVHTSSICLARDTSERPINPRKLLIARTVASTSAGNPKFNDIWPMGVVLGIIYCEQVLMLSRPPQRSMH